MNFVNLLSGSMLAAMLCLTGCSVTTTTTVTETTTSVDGETITETRTFTSEENTKNVKNAEENRTIEHASVTFTNKTDFDVYKIYITPEGDDFDVEVLNGETTLDANHYITFVKMFTYTTKDHVFSVRLVDAYGNNVDFHNVDMLKAEDETDIKITFTCDDKNVFVDVE